MAAKIEELLPESTLYGYICITWTDEPHRFRMDPIHRKLGLNL